MNQAGGLTPGYQQGGVTTINMAPPSKPPPQDYSNYNKPAALAFGGVQILAGIALIIATIVVFENDGKTNTYEYIPLAAVVGAILGFPTGVFYIVSGGIAIAAGLRQTKCLVMTSMVASIIGLVFFTIGPVLFFGIMIGWKSTFVICEDGRNEVGCVTNMATWVGCIVAFACALLLLGCGLAVSIIACQAACCRPPQNDPQMQGQVTYQQQVMTIPETAPNQQQY